MKRHRLELEYIFKASPSLLYQFITTPACLVRWFCDEVDINSEEYTFSWEGADEMAEMIDDIEDERVRFRWEDADDENEFLEFRMYKSDVTNETILEITDFCDDDEINSTRDLWDRQIVKFKQECGG
jgi:uncharacterized protein YndB with AHSA1/START domain